MRGVIANSLPIEINPDELRRQVEPLNVYEGLRLVTQLSSSFYTIGTEDMLSVVSPLSLSLLAKAFILWGDVNGRALRKLDETMLLKSINSIAWDSRERREADLENTMVSYLIRQAHAQTPFDPLDANIGRTVCMFHDIIGESDLPIGNPSSELISTFGVSANDLWILAAAVFCFHIYSAQQVPTPWKFSGEFVKDSPKKDVVNSAMRRALSKIALTIADFRQKYQASGSKYRSSESDTGYWASEFNILRDYPIVKLGEDEYCAPFPIFAFLRGSVGFYFDLIDDYSERERRVNPRNPNPFDNAMSQTLGTVFQRYVGRHLQKLDGAKEYLTPEFKYGSGGKDGDTPDWILCRPERLSIFFECKARRPTLDLQRYARSADIEREAASVVSRALKQFVRFIQRADSTTYPELLRYAKLEKMIYALVLYEPFAFHALPTIRKIIDDAAIKLEPSWPTFRDRILFVPMTIRELETLVAAELVLNIPIEEQLIQYAAYRSNAPAVGYPDGITPIFARHLEEFIQETWNNGRRVRNPLCHELWRRFCNEAFMWIFDQDMDDFRHARLQEAIQLRAYYHWESRGRPNEDDWTDWFRAENEIRSEDSED